MDYDDNDFQGHNLHLAGEGSSKFSPVLNPYALPKFDFDDSLQGQLRFDSLVENEVFLGIPSQEDNQWIEDFSRGSSGIEFSSSVPESCSISRHNNVWSEATSSESVEMLLKSVGQEEMVPGETVIKESDACDELGSLTKQMESNSKQDDRLKDAIDSHPTLPPSEFLENSSGLDESAGRTHPHVDGASQTQVVELSAYGSSSELESSAVDEKCGLCVAEKNLATDRKCIDAIETEADGSVNESLDNKMQKDPSVSGMQICYSSSQHDVASVGELNNQEIQHQLSDTIFENVNGLSNDISKRVEEEHVAGKDTNMDDLNLKGSAVETGTYNLESTLCSAPKLDSLEGHAVESNTNNVEESSLPLERDGDLEIAEGCSEDACSTDHAQGNEHGAVVSSERTEINQQDMLEAPVVFQGDSNIEGHAVEINNTKAGILAVSDLEMGSNMQITHGQSSSIEKKENLLVSDHQLVCEASVNNSEVSLLSGVHFEQSNGQGDGSRNDHVGDPSNLSVVCSSNELLMETKAIEALEVVNDPSGLHKKDVNAEHHVSPPLLAGSEQICESNVVTKQGDVHHAEDVSLNEKGNEKLPTDSCDMDCETVGSLSLDKRVGPSCLGEGIKANDMIVHKSEHNPTAMNELAMNVALENTNLATHNKFDNVSLPSVNGATADGVTNHGGEQESPSLVVGFMNLHGSEETKVEVSKEANLLTLKEFSNGANELGPVSGLETGSSDSAGQLLQVGNEVRQDGSSKLEDRTVLCDSFVKEDDNEAVVLENHGKATREENHDAVTSGVAVDISKDQKRLFGLARLSECDANCALEGGGSYADSDKPNCGSPIIVSCTELSQSEKDLQQGVKGSLGTSVPPSEVSDEIANKVQSTPPTQRGSDATKDERSFSFEVPPSTGQSERESSKGLQSFSTAPSCKISTVVEGASTSGVGKMDPVVMVPEISHGSPRAPNGENSHGRSKGTLGRKTRRVSGKLIGKENTKKGNLVKESIVARQSERGDKSYSVSMSPSGTGQLVQFEGLKPYGNVENSGTRQCGVFSIPASNLLDLNSSTLSSVLFQQPFTDLQQVQLRAQIFVYGSLIQGTVPDEACMVSAFGTSDGGRNVWEPVWRTCVASIQGQKSHPSNSEIPNQSRSGAKASDQAIKQGASQNKVLPSPVGRACSKGTPSPVVNSMIPPSSPLWNISNGLQSSGVAKGTLLDYQPLSPLHPYHTPPTHNFVGHNTSWLSQAPFPGAWVASPQTSAFDGSARFSVMPITEAVKLTPVKESSLSISSSTKHASSSPVVLSGGPSVSAGASSLLDMKKVTVSPGQHSANPKSRKRKKVPVSEDLGHISLLAQTQTESLSTPVVSSHLSTSVVVTTPAFSVSKSNAGKIISNVKPTSSSDQLKLGDQNAEQKLTISEDIFNKVELAKLEAEEAAALAAAAVSHSQDVWNQLTKHKNSRMISDVEAKLASAAVAVAAAAAVAKAAAAAAKVASNAALQAKLMAEGALASGTGNTVISPYNTVNNLGKATPSSILKGEGGDGSNCSNSIIVAAREAARGKLEAASAASKHAENLDAIVKAAELAAEAVSQAGKIVSMGDPLPLRELIDAGPEGYWKVPLVPSEQGVKSNKVSKEHSNVNSVKEGFNVSAKQAKEGPLDERQTTEHGLPPLSREISRESVKDHTTVVDGISGSVTSSEKNLRGQKGRRASDLAKTIGVVPESEIGSRSTSVIIQDKYEKAPGNLTENSIKEGSLVEVFKDGDFKAAWFSANVLTLKDGKALVCYTELQSDEGPGHLQEWVAIEGEDSKAPRIRTAHPMTIMRFEGMRKRRRAAMGDYAWSVGDRVDAWVQDCWQEGVVTEKNRNDETALSVRFPAEGETSVVRAWHLRPTLIWKDGKWIEWSTSREKDSSLQGDMPQQKRLKMASPAIQGEDNDKMSKNIDLVDSMRVEQSNLLPLTANEKIFSVGNHSREENKPDVIRTMRSGLQKEGSKVIFGVPKPGKKRKFMEVSKHYVTERSSNNNESNDSVKFGKYLMPQVSDSRGWKNNSKIDFKEKLAAESKPKVVKSRKPPSVSGRTLSQKDKFLTSARIDDTITDHIMTDSISNDENDSGQRNLREFGSFSNSEEAEEGPILFSSLALPSDVSSKKLQTSNAKSERLNKGKLAASGGKLVKSEVKDKVYNVNMGKTIPEVVEPRRTTRRIQPTSRLLEGLQSSLIISKIPATSHDKSHKSTNKGTSKGNNRG